MVQGRIVWIAEIVENYVFLLNIILDLLTLTVCSDEELYLSKQSYKEDSCLVSNCVVKYLFE
jgi:hypothetical protein